MRVAYASEEEDDEKKEAESLEREGPATFT